MLVEKTTTTTAEPYVASLKLISGEEIIATVTVANSGDHVMVSNPLSMVLAENPENPTQTRVMFTPWMVAAGDNDIRILTAHILGISAAREDAKSQYEQAVKS